MILCRSIISQSAWRVFSTFRAVIIIAQYFHLEYNYSGYCGKYNHSILSVVGKIIDVAVGNEIESFASNRVKNVTLGEYNVSLENEATRVTSGSNIREYNFTFIIQYRVTAGTSTAGISFLANGKTAKIFAHPQSELCGIYYMPPLFC